MTTFLDVAMPLVQAGYTVIPCRPDKKPCIPWGSITTTDAAQIHEWARTYKQPVAGVLTGNCSGVWVVDVDVPKPTDPSDGRKTLDSLQKVHGSLPETFTVETPSGGLHLYFKMPKDGDVRNSVKKAAPGIDVRGTGGYVIAPGSTLPDGRQYRIVSSEPPVLAPDWLLYIVRKTQGRAGGVQAPVQMPVPRPALLEKDGARRWGQAALADECDKVRSTREGARNSTLNTAALRVYQVVAGGSLSEEEAFGALMNAALASGLSENEARGTIESGRKAGLAEPRYYPDPSGARAAQVAPTDWPAPVPFAACKLPKLDVKKLPSVLRDFCEALAEEKQVPVEIAVAMALAALATAAQRRFVVQVREGYREILSLYTVCPLDPGNRKSAVVEACTAPLREWEKRMAEKMAPEIREAKSRHRTIEKMIEYKRNKAAKQDTIQDAEELQREISELEEQLPQIPVVPRLLADNTTPEALAVLMRDMGGCIASITAEGGIFDILAGLYSNGTPNIDLFLKAHSGDSFRVDRRNSLPVILDTPRLSVGMSPQPITLAQRSASKIFRGRGLDGRFLYFLPESLLGRRKLEPSPADQKIKDRFFARVLGLLPECWSPEMPEPVEVELSAEDYKTWLAFAGKVDQALDSGGEFEGMKDWGGKLAGAVARIAGLFHLVTYDRPEGVKISSETMGQAVYMGALLTEHAKAAYALMGADETIERARSVLEWIKRKSVDRFSARDCWQGVKQQTLFSHAADVREALKELEERHYVWELPAEPRQGTGGKPKSPVYLVNPAALRE